MAPETNADPALAQIDQFIADQTSRKKIDRSNKSWTTQLPKPPKLEFSKGKTYYWDLETNVGKLSFKLLHEVAPMHVSSTLYLTRLGFYDNLTFHRVITGFMAQGGDPLGNGRGGPGYQYDGEFDRSVQHKGAGVLSMANAGPGTDGSQFFITFVTTSHLDGKHTVFGMIEGDSSTLGELEKRGSSSGQTKEPLLLQRASVRVA